MAVIGRGSAGMSTKNGGSCTYVLSAFHSYRSPSELLIACHSSGPTVGGRILSGEHFRSHGRLDRRGNFFLSGPDVLQKDIVAVGILSQWFRFEIDINRPDQRVGHHQWRTGQVIGFDQRIDAAFEIPVAGQHGRRHQVAIGHSGGHRSGQGTAVADACRAAITDGLKTQFVQWLIQTRLFEIIRDDARAGSQTAFDPWLALQSPGNRVACQQSRADHHAGVAGIGAAGDGGNHDGTIRDV